MTLTDKLERFFQEHPNTWLDGKDLAGLAGAYAWRSRVSDVRKRFRQRGWDIENRQIRVWVDDNTVYTRSDYRAVIQ